MPMQLRPRRETAKAPRDACFVWVLSAARVDCRYLVRLAERRPRYLALPRMVSRNKTQATMNSQNSPWTTKPMSPMMIQTMMRINRNASMTSAPSEAAFAAGSGSVGQVVMLEDRWLFGGGEFAVDLDRRGVLDEFLLGAHA